MKKIIFLKRSIFVVAAFAIGMMINCGGSESPFSKKIDSNETKLLRIDFTNALPSNELHTFVNQYELKVTKLKFQWLEHAGEYFFSDDTFENEMQTFINAYQNDLQTMIEQLKAALNNDPSSIEYDANEKLLQDSQELLKMITENTLPIISAHIQFVDEYSQMLQDQKVRYITQELTSQSSELTEDERSFFYSSYHESWAPYKGHSKTTRYSAYNLFYFNNAEVFDAANADSTYEHETQIKNLSYLYYPGYWSSNLPMAYFDYDMIEGDYWMLVVGSCEAPAIQNYYGYYTTIGFVGSSTATATTYIKGQLGVHYPSWYCSWANVYAADTTDTMVKYTAPNGGISYTY